MTLLHKLNQADTHLLLTVVQRRKQSLNHWMRRLTHLGSMYTAFLVTLGIAAWSIPTSLATLGTLGLSQAGVHLLKRTVRRQRPKLPAPLEQLLPPPDRFSFPSGHAAASFAVALPFFATLPGWAAGIPVCIAALVGYTRCYLGVHYPGDVLAGFTLTGASALLLSSLIP